LIIKAVENFATQILTRSVRSTFKFDEKDPFLVSIVQVVPAQVELSFSIKNIQLSELNPNKGEFRCVRPDGHVCPICLYAEDTILPFFWNKTIVAKSRVGKWSYL